MYVAPLLPPGMYQIEVTSQGFKKAVRSGVEIRVADRLDISIALEIGTADQQVNVTSELPAAQRRERFTRHGGGLQTCRESTALLR